MALPSAGDYVDFLRTAAGPVVQIANKSEWETNRSVLPDDEGAGPRYDRLDCPRNH